MKPSKKTIIACLKAEIKKIEENTKRTRRYD